MKNIALFLKDETGATAVEYSILAALIAAVIIGTVFLVGQQTKGLFLHTNSVMTEHGI